MKRKRLITPPSSQKPLTDRQFSAGIPYFYSPFNFYLFVRFFYGF